MAGWSIRSAVIAAALASTASAPLWAQQSWSPPPSDDRWQQSGQDDAAPGYDDSAPQAGDDQSDDRWAPDAGDRASSDQAYDDGRSDEADGSYRQDDGAQSDDDDGDSREDGGFASRDSVPPDASPAPASPGDEDSGWHDWHSGPPPSSDTAPEASDTAPPESAPDPQRNGWPAPSGPDLSEPESTPGFEASSGIGNRDQAVSSCLAAVRSRVGGGAGAARVDGINGEWMVSGAIGDGRAFYCSIRHGAIDDVEFGS